MLLRVLLVEDSETDAKLLGRALAKAGFEVASRRVDTAEAMKEALDEEAWDLVLADHFMPEFNALAALDTLKESGIDLPFIIVSGTIGEEVAVEAMRAGAHDYILKGKLTRLAPAIERELHEARVRQERRQAQEALRKAYDELEIRVRERTAELAQVNEQLTIASLRSQELAEEAQRRAAELEAIIENMAEGVSIFDTEGRRLRTNEAGKRTLCLSDSSLGNQFQLLDDDLYYPDGRPLPADESPITRVLREGRFAQQEIVQACPDGSRLNLLVGGSMVYDIEGKPALAVVVFRDITDIRELERQREEFISVVAHDMRGQLAVVKGYADALTRQAAREGIPQKVLNGLEAISASSRVLDRITADLTDASRIESHRLTLTMERTDLPVFIRKSAERLGKLTNGHPVRVEVRGQVPTVKADPDRIEQVLSNLLSNAGKYSCPDSEVTVEIEPGQGEAVVSVTNQGPGIQPEDAEKLFTRFYRTSRGRQQAPGLGLGLYIAKGLVEAHGGRIWVKSEPDKYVTFSFSLPAAGA